MMVAVKVLNEPWGKLSSKQQQDFLLEIRTSIKVSKHENVVRVYGCTIEPIRTIVFEFCHNGSVLDYLNSHKKLTIQQKLTICIQSARGLLSLHEKNVLHRDIAARNILLDRHLTARIADFGMCRVFDPMSADGDAHRSLSTVGPLRWMSPESIEFQISSPESDVWSFAIAI